VQCYATDAGPEYAVETVYRPLDIALGDGVRLVGYEGPDGVRTGDDLPLTVYWQAEKELERDYDSLLRLRASDGPDFARVVQRLPRPPSEWRVGEIISQSVSLEIPAGTPPLTYDLLIEMYESATGKRISSPDGAHAMGTVAVHKPLVPPRLPRMTHEPWANFGNLLQLVGYELEPLEGEAGGEIRLELVWRVWDAPLPTLQVTIELRDGEGQVVATEQGGYLDMAYPSILWEREELVRDVHGLQIPPDISSGSYEVSLTLQAVRTTGQSETLPFWSPAGVWEQTFTLGTVEAAGS